MLWWETIAASKCMFDVFRPGTHHRNPVVGCIPARTSAERHCQMVCYMGIIMEKNQSNNIFNILNLKISDNIRNSLKYFNTLCLTCRELCLDTGEVLECCIVWSSTEHKKCTNLSIRSPQWIECKILYCNQAALHDPTLALDLLHGHTSMRWTDEQSSMVASARSKAQRRQLAGFP